MNGQEIAQLKVNIEERIGAESYIFSDDILIDCKEYIEQLERRNAKLERLYSSVKKYYDDDDAISWAGLQKELAELEKDKS